MPTKHKMAGGARSIGFEDYYWASILTQLRDWFHLPPTTLWGQLESGTLKHHNLKSWILAIPLGIPVSNSLPATMKAAALAWQKRGKMGDSHSFFILSTSSNRYTTAPYLRPVPDTLEISGYRTYKQYLSGRDFIIIISAIAREV